MEVSCQLHALASSRPGKEPQVPILFKVGWAPEPVWTLWRREKSYPCGNRNPAVHPLATHYTNCAIPVSNDDDDDNNNNNNNCKYLHYDQVKEDEIKHS
jgi:hypothetical protein